MKFPDTTFPFDTVKVLFMIVYEGEVNKLYGNALNNVMSDGTLSM
jgi:hypothetical protein